MLRFLNFYPSHQKTFAAGPARARARRDPRRLPRPRDGAPDLQGRDAGRAAAAVADAGLSDHARSCRSPTCARRSPAAWAARRCRRCCRRRSCRPGCRRCARRWRRCTIRRPTSSLQALEDGSHPAAQRLKFEELLAQQLSQLASRAERALLRAPEIAPRAGGLHEKLLARAAVRPDRRAAARGRRDRRRPRRPAADAPPAAGRRRRRQDGGRRAGRGRRDGRRLAVRADGAHRDPGRAALRQARAVAGAAGHRGGLAQRQPQGQGAREGAGAGGQRRRRSWSSARTR